MDLPSCKGCCLTHGEEVRRVDAVAVVQVEHGKAGGRRNAEAAAGRVMEQFHQAGKGNDTGLYQMRIEQWEGRFQPYDTHGALF